MNGSSNDESSDKEVVVVMHLTDTAATRAGKDNSDNSLGSIVTLIDHD
jgi:hypothetical protein